MTDTASEAGRPPVPLAERYDPRPVEGSIYARWKAAGCFTATNDPADPRPAFCLAIPPPNVTGRLHMGHALTVAIEDAVVRCKRMQGFNTLWLPGTDHAGIATQMVVERNIAVTEGKTRADFTRDELLAKAWAWTEAHKGAIREQLEALGCSVDWTRERFTLDPDLNRAVREVFVRLYEDGLMYRGERLVNLSPGLQTIVSDLEVEYEEGVDGFLYAFRYPAADGSGSITVATTRPETMLGDTAVAVHPDDERYKALIGKKLKHPLLGYELPVIADAILVDPTFGTGAVKVTPAHDFNDFATGRRHNLPSINLLRMDGTLNGNAGPYAGLTTAEARKRVVADLAAAGVYEGETPHKLNIGRCQRSGTIIEPFLSKQWFVVTKPLADEAMAAVRSGETRFVPQAWEKTFFHWLENIQDWCVSRQLWWGHRIPAWHCADCDHVTVAREAPAACGGCGSARIAQDPDVLDTWFSSALWPFSTLGWPDETADLAKFYPNGLMETGFDIIFFWVARMMMTGKRFLGRSPFPVVYLHAMVRDHEGNKMSKTKGNVIDPLDIVNGISLDELLAKRERDAKSVGLAADKTRAILDATRKLYPQGIPAAGADGLRMGLLSMAGQGRDIKFDVKRIEGYRLFANKVWQAARYILGRAAEGPRAPGPVHDLPLEPADAWILHRLREAAAVSTTHFEAYAFDQAAGAVYQFIWGELCDWYIEFTKPAARAGGATSEAVARAVLVHVLDGALRLLHPFMPFLTEAIWRELPDAPDGAFLMQQPRPDAAAMPAYPTEAAAVDLVRAVTGAVRTIRGESRISPAVKIAATVELADDDDRRRLEAMGDLVRTLARIDALTVTASHTRSGPEAAAAVPGAGFVHVPLQGVVDVVAERGRLEKTVTKAQGDLGAIEKRLANPDFVSRAAPAAVDADRARAAELTSLIAGLRGALERLV